MSGAVLITGATGYLGRHMAVALERSGRSVHALVRPGSATDDLRAAAPATKLHVYDGAYASIAAAVSAGPFDAILHLAGAGKLETPPAELPALIDVSVTLPAYLMEAAASGASPRIILAGSYWEWSRGENSPANSVYGSAKIACRAIADHYAAFRGLEAIELALHDIYGPKDRRRKLYDLLDECSRSGQALDMTAGEQRIAPIHVADVCWAFETAMTMDAALLPTGRCGVYATPGPEVLSLRDVVAAFQRATGRSVAVNWGARPYPRGQIMQPWIGPLLPNWRPAIKLEQGLREIFGPEISGEAARG